MITMKDLTGRHNFENLFAGVKENLNELSEKVNSFEVFCPEKLVVTSGLRTREDQIGIYNKKGIYDFKRIPFGSMHLQGLACDFYDPEGKIKVFISSHLEISVEIGLWYENFSSTKNWVHLQIRPPKSGNRFFKP